jgi:two-component system cell cycle response regulator DivK
MSKRILVVEDTENNRRILNDLLTKAGFDVIEAIDGEKGVAMAEERRPDLILMDIQLPIIDGYEATRRIKSNPDLRHIPIIAVTSYALSGDEDKARAAGCDDFVPHVSSWRRYGSSCSEPLPCGNPSAFRVGSWAAVRHPCFTCANATERPGDEVNQDLLQIDLPALQLV